VSEPTAGEKRFNHRDTEVTEEKVPAPSAEALLPGNQTVSERAVGLKT
jgi:hypothetical protein